MKERNKLTQHSTLSKLQLPCSYPINKRKFATSRDKLGGDQLALCFMLNCRI